jgi:ketosteroid isomerase-like protein
MPSANLDLVQSLFVAWERGDFSSAEWADPGIEYVAADGPSPGQWEGLTGLVDGWGNWISTWENLRVGGEEYRELDDERILVLVHWSGRGKTSGLELAQIRTKGAGVFHVRDGKVTRVVAYIDRGHAFADLGLTPEGDSPHS